MNYLDHWQDWYENLLPEDFKEEERTIDEDITEEYEDEQSY